MRGMSLGEENFFHTEMGLCLVTHIPNSCHAEHMHLLGLMGSERKPKCVLILDAPHGQAAAVPEGHVECDFAARGT